MFGIDVIDLLSKPQWSLIAQRMKPFQGLTWGLVSVHPGCAGATLGCVMSPLRGGTHFVGMTASCLVIGRGVNSSGHYVAQICSILGHLLELQVFSEIRCKDS